jgi:hypothetical protein
LAKKWQKKLNAETKIGMPSTSTSDAASLFDSYAKTFTGILRGKEQIANTRPRVTG